MAFVPRDGVERLCAVFSCASGNKSTRVLNVNINRLQLEPSLAVKMCLAGVGVGGVEAVGVLVGGIGAGWMSVRV